MDMKDIKKRIKSQKRVVKSFSIVAPKALDLFKIPKLRNNCILGALIYMMNSYVYWGSLFAIGTL